MLVGAREPCARAGTAALSKAAASRAGAGSLRCEPHLLQPWEPGAPVPAALLLLRCCPSAAAWLGLGTGPLQPRAPHVSRPGGVSVECKTCRCVEDLEGQALVLGAIPFPALWCVPLGPGGRT